MNKIKDLFNLLVIVFSIIISIMFFYLYTLANSMKDYNFYKSSFNSLISVNQELNNFMEKKDRFVNFDSVVENINKFETVLNTLKTAQLKKEFGNEFYEKVIDLSSTYKNKVDLIERYKSRQATNLNSIHYIYELNQYFIKNKKVKNELKIVINSTLFMLMQNFINLNDNKNQILKNLEFIHKENKKLSSQSLKLLYIHAQNILDNNEYIRNINKESKSLMLKSKLDNINIILLQKYEAQLFHQILISIFFFLSIIVILFMIYKEHKKSLKIKNELYAFKYAVENSDNSVILTDKDRNILYVNDNFEKNTGFLKDEIKGLKPTILGSGETPSETYENLNKRLAAGEKWEGEFINKRKDGSYFYEKASIVPIVIDGELKNYLAIKLDVTKYIEQNESIKLSSIAFNNIQEGILICDSNKIIITANEAFESITGYKKDEITGLKCCAQRT